MNQNIFFFGLVCCLNLTLGQINKPDSEAYCYQFTWLGPNYKNVSIVNSTCPNHKNFPCVKPCVVTTNAGIPNTTWMWENMNRTDITCPLRSGVCIKYTYSYNNAVLSAAYFCGKMTEGRTNPIDNGCYTYTVDGHVIEACACKSFKGSLPCNLSSTINWSLPIIILSILLCSIYCKLWSSF